jgi:hypothetical protein
MINSEHLTPIITIESYEDLLLSYEYCIGHSNINLIVNINSNQQVGNISFHGLKIKNARIDIGTHVVLLKTLPKGIKWCQVKQIELYRD